MTVYNYEFTGAVQTRTLPSGIYQFKCWGAQGGDASSNRKGGLGGYVTGTITLAEETDIYVYVGGAGGTGAKGIGGFNGGGNGYGNTVASCGGGGASDIRIGTDSLYSRVIVAGGGGGGLDHGSTYTSGNGGYGGGITGGDGTRSSGTGYSGTGGSLIAGGVCQYAKTTEKYKGAFGIGGGRDNTTENPSKGGGGSGWYGGGCGVDSGGGGGSAWVYRNNSYQTWLAGNPTDANKYLLTSDYYLTSTVIKTGNETFKSPTNVDETGHAGNGYVRVQSLIKVVYDNSQSVIHGYAGDFVVESDTNTWYLDAGDIAETVQDIIDIFNDSTKVMMEQYYSVDDVYADSDYITKLSPDTILTDIPMTTVYVKPVMHLYNKVVYGDETLIDLTTDTVTANRVLSGYTAHIANGEQITGTCNFDANTSDANATASEIVSGKSAYVNGSKIDGIMINVGGQTESISTKSQTVSISHGYHDGSGSVSIDATEQAKIVAENIKKDVSILGVTGTLTQPVYRVQYVETDGDCWFDTGIRPDYTLAFECNYVANKTSVAQCIFGSRNRATAQASDANNFFVLNSNLIRRDYYGKSETTTNVAITNTTNVREVYVYKHFSRMAVAASAQTATTGTVSSGISDNTLYIFASNNNNTAGSMLTGKLYRFTIYKEAVVLHNYVPVLDPSGVPCIYDEIDKQYIYKSGDGTLTYG